MHTSGGFSCSCLLDEQASVELLHQQTIAGRRTRRVNKKYVVIQNRLNTISERYDRGHMSAVDYITAVSHNLIWPKGIEHFDVRMLTFLCVVEEL